MLSSEWWNNKASDIKLVYLYSSFKLIFVVITWVWVLSSDDAVNILLLPQTIFASLHILIRPVSPLEIIPVKKKNLSGYRPGVAQRVGTGIALLFHDRGTRREWVVSSTPRPHFTPGKDPVPILQEAGWVPGPVWTGGKSLPSPGFDPRPSSP